MLLVLKDRVSFGPDVRSVYEFVDEEAESQFFELVGQCFDVTRLEDALGRL